MHSYLDLYCGERQVEVHLDESIRTTEARELVERTLIERRQGRLFPTTKGFMYTLPDEAWDLHRIVERLHNLLKELFGDDYSVGYRNGNDEYIREPDGCVHTIDRTVRA